MFVTLYIMPTLLFQFKAYHNFEWNETRALGHARRGHHRAPAGGEVENLRTASISQAASHPLYSLVFYVDFGVHKAEAFQIVGGR